MKIQILCYQFVGITMLLQFHVSSMYNFMLFHKTNNCLELQGIIKQNEPMYLHGKHGQKIIRKKKKRQYELGMFCYDNP